VNVGSGASSLEKRGLSQKGSFWYHFSAKTTLSLNTLRAELSARVSYCDMQSGVAKQVMSASN